MLKFMIDDRHNLVTVGEFPKSKAKALEASIQKWQHLARSSKLTAYTHDRGQQTCALCHLYYRHSCAGCPVACAAGETFCGGTPYGSFVNAYEVATRRGVAREMVRFLASLRQKRTPQRLRNTLNISKVKPL